MEGVKLLLQTEEDNLNERKVMEDNLKALSEFVEVLRERGTDNMDNDIIDKMKKIKEEWNDIIEETNTKEVKVKQGAIPKKKSKYATNEENNIKKKVILKSSSSSDSTLSEESDLQSEDESDSRDERLSSSSEQDTKTKKKKKCRKEKKRKISASSEDEKLSKFLEVVQKLDNRKVPTPEKFDEKSGNDLEKYLLKFEKYCEDNFKCSRNMWLVELEKYLSGRVLQALQIMRDDSESYYETKGKLLEWFNNSKDSRKRKQRDLFKRTNYIKDESLYLYMARLEKQFKNAYPHHNVDDSKIIIKKLLSSLPKSIKGQMKAQIMSYKLNDRKIKWKTLKKWAKCFDLEREDETSMSEEGELDREVVITLGQRDGYVSDDMLEVNRNEYYKDHNSNLQQKHSGAPRAQQQRQVVQRNYFTHTNNDSNRNSVRCNYCNRIGHSAVDCRSRLRQCFGCGGDGHVLRNCPNRNRNMANYVRSMERNNGNKREYVERKDEHETHYNEKLNYQPLAQLRDS